MSAPSVIACSKRTPRSEAPVIWAPDRSVRSIRGFTSVKPWAVMSLRSASTRSGRSSTAPDSSAPASDAPRNEVGARRQFGGGSSHSPAATRSQVHGAMRAGGVGVGRSAQRAAA